MDAIAEILERADLRGLAERAGAAFNPPGRGTASRCPLHGGDNPTAFHLYRGSDGRQRWHCFTRCPQGQNDGDAIGFYMSMTDVFTDHLHPVRMIER